MIETIQTHISTESSRHEIFKSTVIFLLEDVGRQLGKFNYQCFWREQWSATSQYIISFNSKTYFSESKNGQIYIVLNTVYNE